MRSSPHPSPVTRRRRRRAITRSRPAWCAVRWRPLLVLAALLVCLALLILWAQRPPVTGQTAPETSAAAAAFGATASLPPPTLPPTQTLWLPQIIATEQVAIPTYGYRVIHEYPHDPRAFTQGLVFHEGALYEGTGLNGYSSVRRVALETGRVLQQVDLSTSFFGEGLTIWGDRIIQLTWQSQQGFVYALDTLAVLGVYAYPGEGWGLTHDGERLIMSDGTAELRFWAPVIPLGGSPSELGRITVRDDQGPVLRLNELEYVRGQVYANVWQTDRIARIDPQSGRVVGWIDLTGLLSAQDQQQGVDVLNGIAYDAAGDRLFVTGKWWPKLFHIELVPTNP